MRLAPRDTLAARHAKLRHAITAAELDGLFIRAGDARFWGGEGHYTVAGNRFFAQALHAKIRATIDAAARRAND